MENANTQRLDNNYPMRTVGLCDQYNSISAKVKFDLLKCLLSKLHSGSRRLNSYTIHHS
jgi:hypothetical protein